MAVAFGTANSTAEATTVDTVYVAPASIANGDVLFIYHFELSLSLAAPPTPTAPAGFTLAPGTWPLVNTLNGATNARVWLWYKIASGESGNYTVTHTSCINRGIIARVTGANTADPFDPDPTQNTGTGVTTTFTGLTTTIDSCLEMAFGQDNNDKALNLTAPTGTTPTFTERIDDIHGNYLATGNLSPAAASGNKTMTNNSNAGQPWLAVLVSVQPSGAVVALPSLTMAPLTH